MTTTSSLTEQEIRAFAEEWYRKLDVHAPLADFLPLLADEDLEMRFPEGIERGHAGFSHWYERVIRLFFDEVHTVKEVGVMAEPDPGGTVPVRVVVNWQARTWDPPAPKSASLGFDAYQTWAVRRSARTRQPEVVTYIVDSLEPMPGSASL
jgi:hypothetical protein